MAIDLDLRETRYAGTRVRRVEDSRLLTGRGTFVDDVERPRLLHACFVRSPLACGRIVSIDTTEAEAVPGVHAVFVAADLNPDLHELWFTGQGRRKTTPLPPLAEDVVRFMGDPVALVIADDRYLAEDAAELVFVDVDPLPPVVDFTTATESTEVVHEGFAHNIVGEAGGGSAEAVEEALAGAAHVVRETIHQQACTAVPIETRGAVVEWDPAGEELTIWASTQAPHEMRSICSRVLGVPEARIRVIARDTGGGFGQKVVPAREDVCLWLAARKVRGAIKWVEDRRENLLSGGQARRSAGEAVMGFDAEGTIVAARIDHVEDVGAYPIPWPVDTGSSVGMLFPGPYRVPTGAFTHRSVFTNTVGRTAYRGPWQFESVARELLLDISARRMGIDPVELRRRNILRADEQPYFNPCGMLYAEVAPDETLEQALEILGYEAFRREQEEARRAGRHLGVGVACYVEPTTPGYSYYASEGATIRIDPSGRVTVLVAGGSSGNSLETTAIQLTADALGVPLEDVSTVQGDTALTPSGAGTGGSRSGVMIAGAVAAAAGVLKEKVLTIAAHRLGAALEDMVLEDGQVFARGARGDALSLAKIAETAYFHTLKLPPGVSSGLEATERYTAPSPMPVWVNATHVCTCEVDVETGEVTLLRYIVSEDCGPMINPAVVEGQIAGGTVQGIGGALLEELAYDGDGNAITTTFMDYLLPLADDVPTIEYGHIETPSSAPGGHKGVGEGGAIGSTPAVANAVADALAPFGATVTRLPLTPEVVLGLVRQAGDA
ncbi:MAG: xanthine dehydrogenase family protein molybdopterin-binding subunit [Acidimicrobiales bacterium]